MELDIKEYNSVVLAALLHDVGKFLHRVTRIEELPGKHQDLGADFVGGKGVFSAKGGFSHLGFFSAMIKEEWVYKEKLEQAVRKHHSGFQPWGWIVHKADSYSTKERFKEGEGVTTYPPKGRILPLKPIFSGVSIGKVTPTKAFGYEASYLDTFRAFPEENKLTLDNDETSNLFKAFIEELKKLDLSHATFKKFYNTLHSLFEKYFWCLPCHAHPDIADVSIFDHLKSSSALAACLYRYHSLKGTLEVKYVKNDDEKKFLLVGGNISGIQNYIYQISSITGEGGVAKRLRARSFYVSALLETIIVKILTELNLPESCNLISAGGKFIILAPNVAEVRDRLSALYAEIADWLLEEFSGELSLIMDWEIELQGDDFYRTTAVIGESSSNENSEIAEEQNSAKQRSCNFRDRLDELMYALEKDKFAKCRNLLHGESNWREEKFIRTSRYTPYFHGTSDCRSCRKFPVEYGDPYGGDEGEKVLCKQCMIDKVIGRNLLDAQYLAIGRDDSGEEIEKTTASKPLEWTSFFFFKDNYYIRPLTSFEWQSGFIAVQRLRDHKDETQPMSLGTPHRLLANYTPFFEGYSENEELCEVCREVLPCEQIEMMRRSPEQRHLYTFSCIAAASSERTENAGQYRGHQLIGVLKADVDNLGLIFSEGLQDMLTISRYLTMSRMLDLFFSGWVYRILKETPEFCSIYIVYSGGDDLVLVGPWEVVISFAFKLNKEFRRFTCHNDNITLSAGIAVVHPKFPISSAVALADRYLELSKNLGKDRITLFDTTVEWSALDKLFESKDLLEQGHRSNGDILTTGFIHRLLVYQKMYREAKEGDIGKLIFHSHMNYDVRRNLTEKIEDVDNAEKRQWFTDNISPLMLSLYQTPLNENLMKNLKIPVYWTLYKNRKYRKGGVE